MPGPLRPRAVYDELEAARAALSAGESPVWRYFTDEPVVAIYRDGVQVAREQIQICDLSGWTVPPTAESVPLPFTPPAPPPPPLTCVVSVDPKLGRLIFLDGVMQSSVHVTYFHGFSAEMGGGGYSRLAGTAPPANATTYDVDVENPALSADNGFVDALNTWEPTGADALFVFRGPSLFSDNEGSGIFAARDFTVPAGKTVVLRAADRSQPLIRLTAPWTITLAEGATLVWNGLLVAGAPVHIETQGASSDFQHVFTLEDCTIVPGLYPEVDGSPVSPDAICLSTTTASQGALQINLVRSIVGRVDLSAGAAGFTGKLVASDSILDGAGDPTVTLNAPGGADLSAVTVLGKTAVGTLEASDCIFDQQVMTTRTQTGCVRFSFVPNGSTTPRAYRCQPALALSATTDPMEQLRILSRLLPSYTSVRYGAPGYAQLARLCPVEISAGAESGREMGGFYSLMQPQRLANLQTSLDEYLRFGLEAGVFLVT
jgi:hypothetical protein